MIKAIILGRFLCIVVAIVNVFSFSVSFFCCFVFLIIAFLITK